MTDAAPLPPGTAVHVKPNIPPGHIRAPFYLRGKIGTIERVLAEFGNPEQLAYGLDAQKKRLYRVRFDMQALWGSEAEHSQDTVDAEIYEHWLTPAEAPHAT